MAPRAVLAALGCVLLNAPVLAGLADKLGRFTGYTIVASKTISGYVDEDGKKSDDFEGCDFDRKILFDDGTSATCASYSYTYAYRPTAVLLMKELSVRGLRMATVVMMVDDETYDMPPIRLR